MAEGTVTRSDPGATRDPHPRAAPAGWHPPPTPCQPPPANKNKLTCSSVNFPTSIHPGLITRAIPGAGGSGRL